MPAPFRFSLVLLSACMALSTAGIRTAFAEDSDRASATEPARELAIGTELVALADVTLHRASIAKGSKVTVTKVSIEASRIVCADLELADGHVVTNVSRRAIFGSFVVAD